jgi:hypothetical protein
MTDKVKQGKKVKSVIVSGFEVQGYVVYEGSTKKTPFTFDAQSFTADTMSRLFTEIQEHFE